MQGAEPSAFATPEPSEVCSGARVGRYVLVRKLGQGGMGEVWSAADPQLDRVVAIKVVRPSAADLDREARLLEEAQTLARLAHPNVVRVYDVGRYGSRVFVAMERLGGGTLDAWAHRQSRGWREVARALCAAGDGLAAAHDAGVVHRDFKPQNVLLSEDGRACVSDFGLAVAQLDATPGPSGRQSWTLAGTEHYLAPELRDGGRPTPLSDQYSFCVVATDLLAGAPTKLHRVLARGLRERPDERYPDLRALLAQLRAAVQRRSARNVAAWSLGLLAVTGVSATMLGNSPPACEPPSDLRWAADERAEIDHALASAGLAQGPRTRMMQRLDESAAAWADVAADACRPRGLEARVRRCLAARRAEFETTTQWLRSADVAVRTGGGEAVAHLLDASQCRSETFESSPPAAEEWGAIADIEIALGRARALRKQQRPETLRSELLALVDQAERVEHRATRARAWLELASVQRGQGQLDAGRGAAERATRYALESRDPSLLVETWLELMVAERTLADSAASARLRTWIESLIASGQVRPESELVYWYTIAWSESADEKYVEATAAWERALALNVKLRGSDDPFVTLTRTAHAWTLAMQGNVRDAVEIFELALPVLEREFDSHSAAMLATLSRFADVLLLADEVDRAQAVSRRALKIDEELGDDGTTTPLLLTTLSRALLRSDDADPVEILALMDRAHDEARQAFGPSHPGVISMSVNRVTPLIELDRADEALLCARAGVAALDTPEESPLPNLAYARLAEGIVLVELERYDEAITVLQDSATQLAERVGAEAPITLEARVALSLAMTRAGHDRLGDLTTLVALTQRIGAREVELESRAALAEAMRQAGHEDEARRRMTAVRDEAARDHYPRIRARAATFMRDVSNR